MIEGGARDGGAPPDSGPTDVEAAHAALLDTPRYQFSPTERPPLPQGIRMPDWLASLLDGIAALLEILFWVGLAGLAGLVLWLAARALFDAWRSRTPDEAETHYAPTAQAARTLLEDAARLAAEGRYGEAVRLILKRSVEDMERQRPGTVRTAMTSREIAVLPILTEAAQSAFSRIAALVERAAFAGRALSEAEYEEAHGIYRRLTDGAMRGGS